MLSCRREVYNITGGQARAERGLDFREASGRLKKGFGIRESTSGEILYHEKEKKKRACFMWYHLLIPCMNQPLDSKITSISASAIEVIPISVNYASQKLLVHKPPRSKKSRSQTPVAMQASRMMQVYPFERNPPGEKQCERKMPLNCEASYSTVIKQSKQTRN